MTRKVAGRTSTTRWAYRLAGVAAAVTLAAACTPGSNTSQPSSQPAKPVSTDVAKAGNVTLRVWDQEVRGGQNAEITKLNKEFQDKYPNVTIDRTAKSFTNLKDTLKLALSGDNPPDVVEANQGYPDMGAFVQAGMLLPLDKYAQAYGWRDRYASTLLRLNSFTPDGKTFGEGNLYGLSQTGEIIGVYYNKQKMAKLGLDVPRTWAQFTTQLQRIKAAGELPIIFGNKDQWPAIHTFGMFQNHTLSKEQVQGLVFGTADASWATPQDQQAAATLQDWVEKGYLSPGANGLGYDQAAAEFGKGKGVYLVTGTWLAADLMKSMGDNVGFFVPPPTSAGAQPFTTGGQGLSWSVTAKSGHADVAAAYIDFITTAHAADVMTQTGNLPAMSPESAKPEQGTVLAQIFAAWSQLRDNDGLVPYLDYSTPGFYDTLTVQLQQLIGGRSTPKQFVDALQKEYADFQSG